MKNQLKKHFLVERLVKEGWLKTKPIIKAFTEVDRRDFVLTQYKEHAYIDEPLPTFGGQTISAPSMVAIMTELLEPKKTDKVLEIGAGSGYQAAILAKLVKKVFTIEFDQQLADFAKHNLKGAKIKNVEVIVGDGSKGYAKHAPYDKIIVTCACKETPKPLIKQLKINGRLVAPVGGNWYQNIFLITKNKNGKLKKEKLMGCIFVPLRH